jgi:hypothetical protein
VVRIINESITGQALICILNELEIVEKYLLPQRADKWVKNILLGTMLEYSKSIENPYILKLKKGN